MATMKGFGCVIHGSTVGYLEKEIPEPKLFEGLLEPIVVSPCTSDAHVAFHRANNPAMNGRILGHEAVGRIVKLGPGCTEYKVGDIVAVPATTPNWRTVDAQDGNSQHTGGLFGGMKISTAMDGVFAEYFIVPDVEMNTAIVPKEISLEKALMIGDMMTTGFTGVDLADVQFGDTVVVFGIGPVGLMAIAGAKLRGAGRIIALGTRSKCKELAYIYGATDIIPYGNEYEMIMDLTGGKPVDCTIICGGNTNTIETAYSVTRPGGVISNMVAHTDPKVASLDVAKTCRFAGQQRLVGGLCTGGRRRLERLMELVKYDRVDPSLMLTHTYYGLEGCETGLHAMNSKVDDLIKPIVYMQK